MRFRVVAPKYKICESSLGYSAISWILCGARAIMRRCIMAPVRAPPSLCCSAQKLWRRFAVATSTPDDVRDIARPVLRHRLTLRAEAELDGATPDSVITDILQSAEVPR